MLKMRKKIYVAHCQKTQFTMFGFFRKVKIEGATTPKCILYHLCNKMQL